jgi:septum formation inhibitor-activating ATPase MinD
VLNRADDKVGLSHDKVESTLGMKITTSIPTSSQVPNATNSGEPITASLPKHAVSVAITGLARDIASSRAAVEQPAAAAAPKSRVAPRRGLFSRSK